MATDDQTAGVQRFWVWAPGMLATTQDGRRKVRITEHTLGVGHEMVPDLSDAATVAAIARTAQAEAERLRSAIAETLRLAGIYAGVAAHNAEAEPETAGEAWRSPYMATMRELRRALGGAA